MERCRAFIGSEIAEYINQPGIYIVGFPFDGTTSFRPGARFGPSAIRDVSEGIETYSPYLDKDIEDYPLFDLGNLDLLPSRWDLMNKQFLEITGSANLKSGIKILTLGGEHSISEGPISLYLKQFPDLVLLHLDAHADLRDGYLEEKHSHASIMRRSLDFFGPNNQLIQYGIRSGTRDEFIWMKEHKTLRTSLQELCDDLEALPATRPIYLTLDLDFFDPAYLPGTGTPETGGETYHSFIKIMKILNRKNLVGADVVELAPMLDPTQNSTCMASKVVREVIAALGN